MGSILPDEDGLANFQEEIFGTNPLLKDSDFDLIKEYNIKFLN